MHWIVGQWNPNQSHELYKEFEKLYGVRRKKKTGTEETRQEGDADDSSESDDTETTRSP